MDLFGLQGNGVSSQDDPSAPLAWRMRPRTLGEFVGQSRVVGSGRLLWRMIRSGRPFSLIIHGPPGCGKTALARVAAGELGSRLQQLNAVSAGVADLKRVRDEAGHRRARGESTILFLDEIHRFNRAQQDVLLPMVETGLVHLIGASTHNPFFAVIPPLASRSTLVRFDPLDEKDLGIILDRALGDSERGLGALGAVLEEDARRHLISGANGDARRLLNALEIAVNSLEPADDGTRRVTLEVAAESMQGRTLAYDRDEHYDTASAFIKSMRGSDPDATLFWMAKMIEGGEDPLFIARRIVICAAEDVGLAAPLCLVVAEAAQRAVESVGMPEGRIILAEAALHVACAPKSNSAYRGIDDALDDIRSGRDTTVPQHLRGTSYQGAARLGHGEGYKYPHDFPGHRVAQRYLSHDASYYKPSRQGQDGGPSPEPPAGDHRCR